MKMSFQCFPHARRDFLVSIIALVLLLICVLAGLAQDANWRKIWRVLIAFSVYIAVLLTTFLVRDKSANSGASLSYWPFALAAVAAELASGWLRIGVAAGVTFWVAPVAALLVGGTHWLALRTWRPLREYLTSVARDTRNVRS